MDHSFRTADVNRAGRGALICAMLGAGWLGWGLGKANAFNSLVGAAFGFTALFLFACSIYLIRKGRQLGKLSPAASAPSPRTVLKPFLIVALVEAAAIVLVSILASRLHRTDLAADWLAIVVGLHFLPLARIFRAPTLSVLGVLMTVWCIFCWVIFYSGTIAIAVFVGTGVLLWGCSVWLLLRARRIERAFRA